MKYIAYYRVSDPKQGKSGLGLEAQQHSVKQYLNNKDYILLEEHIEIESAKGGRKRPRLQDALESCKKHKAMLIIAKLDRLSRNVHFISGLMESGVEFVAVDNPHATRLMLHILAAFAEHEREQISKRTKEALTAAKQRGVKLGNNGKSLAIANKQAAIDFALSMKPVIDSIMDRDIITIRAITAELNRMNVATFHNRGQWHIPAVFKVMQNIRIIV